LLVEGKVGNDDRIATPAVAASLAKAVPYASSGFA
jgi:hypothetical protein